MSSSLGGGGRRVSTSSLVSTSGIRENSTAFKEKVTHQSDAQALLHMGCGQLGTKRVCPSHNFMPSNPHPLCNKVRPGHKMNPLSLYLAKWMPFSVANCPVSCLSLDGAGAAARGAAAGHPATGPVLPRQVRSWDLT